MPSGAVATLVLWWQQLTLRRSQTSTRPRARLGYGAVLLCVWVTHATGHQKWQLFHTVTKHDINNNKKDE